MTARPGRGWLAAMLAGSCLALVGCGSAGNGGAGDGHPTSLSRSTPSDPSTISRSSQVPSASTRAGVGHEASSQVNAQRPRSLTLPSGTSVSVDIAHTSSAGELMLPRDVNRAGWWDGGGRLGDPFGALVVAAHVDSFDQGLGHFAELLSTQRGDVIRISSPDLTGEFRVVSAELVEKATLSAESDLYSPRGQPRLVLITCGGPYDPDSGYRDNMVVIAALDSLLERRP